jgi:hypothetical protein
MLQSREGRIVDVVEAVLFFLLVGLAAWAIAGAKEVKGKLVSLLVIAAFVLIGLGIGYGFGVLGKNRQVGIEIATPLAYLLGLAGTLGRIRENKRKRMK